jgi:trimethylguanosine synthase
VSYYIASLEEISKWVPEESAEANDFEVTPELERVEVKEEWMGIKLKALTCYFGGLVTGQEHLFERVAWTG